VYLQATDNAREGESGTLTPLGWTRRCAALVLLHERLNTTYALCDAVSFVLMRYRGITGALNIDHHCEQAWFVRMRQPHLGEAVPIYDLSAKNKSFPFFRN
jgi:hypothetical protein